VDAEAPPPLGDVDESIDEVGKVTHKERETSSTMTNRSGIASSRRRARSSRRSFAPPTTTISCSPSSGLGPRESGSRAARAIAWSEVSDEADGVGKVAGSSLNAEPPL